MRTLIVGGGIGGLCLARSLAKHDLTCTVLEIAKQQAMQYASANRAIILHPNASRILYQYGIFNKIEAAGSASAVSKIVSWGNERKVLDQQHLKVYEEKYGFPRMLWIPRNDLQRILLEDLPKDVEVVYDAKVLNVKRNDDEISFTIASGIERSGAYGVAANGRGSTLREFVRGKPNSEPMPNPGRLYRVYTGIVEARPGVDDVIRPHEVISMVRGNGQFMEFTASNLGGGRVAWNLTTKSSGISSAVPSYGWSVTTPHEVLALVKEFSQGLRGIISQTPEIAVTSFTEGDTVLPPVSTKGGEYFCGRLSLLGDAVQPLPPLLGLHLAPALAIEEAETYAVQVLMTHNSHEKVGMILGKGMPAVSVTHAEGVAHTTAVLSARRRALALKLNKLAEGVVMAADPVKALELSRLYAGAMHEMFAYDASQVFVDLDFDSLRQPPQP